MKFNKLLKVLTFGLMTCSVLAEYDEDEIPEFTGECHEIVTYLKDKGYGADFNNCEMDENDKVIDLDIYTYCLTEEDVNKLISYKTLKSITINTPFNSRNSPVKKLSASCDALSDFPSGISDLENLENLTLYGLSNFKENDLLKIPKSVKSLKFANYDVPQFFIHELSSLTNLESLSFRVVSFNNTMHLEPLKALTKVKSLTMDNSRFMVHVDTDIPENLINKFANLKKLYIKDYALSQTTIKEIASLTKLESLDMEYCSYAKVDNIDDFKNLRRLTALNILNYNKKPLKDVSKYIYTLTKLKKLTISYQDGTYFPSSKTYNIGNLDKLEYLDLSINDYDFDLKYLGYLDQLKHLDLKDNRINSIPKTLGYLDKLEYLDVSNNNITVIPSSIGDLEVLKYLDISRNNIKTLPKTFGGLEQLETLHAQENQITKLPSSIGELISAQFIDLEENCLEKLPSSIGDLVNVKTLYLNNNNLKSLPSSIGNLASVEFLQLNNNNITVVPNTIGNLKNVSFLHLEHNKIKKIPVSIGKLTNLTYLYLNDNLINDSLPESFNNLINLNHIDLSNNIDIKGKTLTLDNIYSCYYNINNDDGKVYSICKAKDVACLSGIDSEMTPFEEMKV